MEQARTAAGLERRAGGARAEMLGGGLGLLFATWGRDALVAFAPAGAPRFEGIGFDWRVMAFTFLLATFTTILFGLWPAWQASCSAISS